MALSIIEETRLALPEYEKISIAFRVESQFRLETPASGLGGILLVEEPVEHYIKDYDVEEKYRPSQWPNSWDVSSWGFLAAFHGNQRIGGATVAGRLPEITLSDGRDICCLWDLRVHPDFRSQGVGSQLFRHAMQWARQRGCRRLMIETQNTNVPACRFYVRQGCKLGVINRSAYPEAMNEVQLLWYRVL